MNGMNGRYKQLQDERGFVPDCKTCIKSRTCERAEENTFCGAWASKDPEKRMPDPNELWERGEPVEF